MHDILHILCSYQGGGGLRAWFFHFIFTILKLISLCGRYCLIISHSTEANTIPLYLLYYHNLWGLFPWQKSKNSFFFNLVLKILLLVRFQLWINLCFAQNNGFGGSVKLLTAEMRPLQVFL